MCVQRIVSLTYHEGDGVAAQTVREQLGEFTVPIRYMALPLLGVSESRYTVSCIRQTVSEQYYVKTTTLYSSKIHVGAL